jgi:PAS domain S-box-containing protein
MRNCSELLQKPRQLRLLIVDDHQIDAEFIIRELNKGGFVPEWKRVSTSKDMDTALDAGTWDVIISEFKMPQFTGIEALHLLQRKNLDIPFIIFSGAIGEEMAVESMKAGASDCIGKDKIIRLPAAVEHEINKARMRLENARAEARYRTILHASMDGFWMTDIQGCLLEVNETYCRMSGYSAPELLGMRISDLESAETNDEIAGRIIKIMAKGEDRFESRQHRKDGSFFDVEVSVQYRAAEGRLVVFVRDISERKRAEEALQYERTLVLALMENLPDRIYFKDSSSHFLRVNPAMVKLFGVSDPAEIIGKTDADFFSAEHAQQALADEQAILRSGQPILGIEEKETWPDGHEGWALTSKLPLRDPSGSIIGTCGISRDITERKRAADALRESEARLHTLVKTIPDLVWLKDPNGVFIACNTMFERLFGAKEADIIGKTDYDFLTRDLADFFRDLDRKVIAAGKPSINEEWNTFKDDGHRVFLETIKTPMYDSMGTLIGVLGIGRDITARKRTEEELRENERKWSIILETVQTGIVIIDPDTHAIVDVNPAAAKLIGETKERLIGSVCHRHICPAEKGNCPITDLKQTVDNSERMLLKADGTSIPIIKTVVSFPLDGHQYLLESFMDISEHKRPNPA